MGPKHPARAHLSATKVVHALAWPSSLALGLFGAGCLQLNGDFSNQAAGAQPDTTRVSTSSQAGATGPLTDTSTGSLAPGTSGSESPGDGLTSNSTYPAGSSVPPTTSSATSSTATSPSTSTSSAPANPIFRRAIEVVNRASSAALEAGYAIPLEFDHAALVNAGYRVDGSDLAVVSRVGGTDTLLPRALDPASAWNQSKTKIWFSLPQTLPAGQALSDRYFLLMANPLFPGTEQPNQVFLAYDSFEGSSLDPAAWSVQASTVANSAGQDVANGQLHLWSSGQGSGSFSQIQSIRTWQWSGVRMVAQATARGGATSGAGGCSRERILAAWSSSDNHLRSAITQTQTSLYFESQHDTSGTRIERITAVTPDTSPHRFVIDWQGSAQELHRDQTHLGDYTGVGTLKSPDAAPMRVGMGTSAFGGSCEGLVSELLVDWVLVRPLTSPEPVATLLDNP